MKRPGSTEKSSISVKQDDLVFLKKHSGGNVSAAIAALVEAAKLDKARADLIEWAGLPPLTDEEREEIRLEQEARKPAPKGKKRRAA